jgi:hypothetical protein
MRGLKLNCIQLREESIKKRQVEMYYADPWVFKGFGGRDALGRVDSQHLIDEIFGFWCHRVPFR